MDSQPSERTTEPLVDRVFNQIFGLIQSGELPLGGVINEVALAERFAVSRGPVREAVKRLQGRGLVVKEPYLKARVVALSANDIVEIFQLRGSVEGMAVRLATERMSENELDRLLADFTDSRRLAERPVLDVHVRIAESCGNGRIRRLLCDELYYLMRIYRTKSGASPGRRADAFSEHWQILRAMKARDADLADSLMRSHIHRATRTLIASLDDQGTGAPHLDLADAAAIG